MPSLRVSKTFVRQVSSLKNPLSHLSPQAQALPAYGKFLAKKERFSLGHGFSFENGLPAKKMFVSLAMVLWIVPFANWLLFVDRRGSKHKHFWKN